LKSKITTEHYAQLIFAFKSESVNYIRYAAQRSQMVYFDRFTDQIVFQIETFAQTQFRNVLKVYVKNISYNSQV